MSGFDGVSEGKYGDAAYCDVVMITLALSPSKGAYLL